MRHLAFASAIVGAIVGCDRPQRPAPDQPVSTASAAAPLATKTSPPPTAAHPRDTAMPMPPPASTRPLAMGSNAFAFDLWSRISRTQGNVAVSPASISIAMAMTWGGAKGDTAAQIKRVMHFELDQDATASSWGNLSRALAAPDRPVRLRIANRLFGEKTYSFEQPFLDKTRAAFGAPLEPTDFRGAFEPARARINAWVEEQTEKRIVDLLPPGSVDALTRLALVNAIYFFASWAEPFDKNFTKDAPFELSAAAKKDVPTMRRRGTLPYAQLDGVKLLKMPYKGADTAMIVLLPDQRDGLAAVEKSLTAAKLDAWTKALAPGDVAVALPRFEVSPPTMELAAELEAMGMPLAFDKDRADFTGLATPPLKEDRLYVSKVFHKAFVKTDEAGTEAAAATAVMMPKGGGPPPKALEFKADHPFVFFIVDEPSGLVLFMGRVADPTAK